MQHEQAAMERQNMLDKIHSLEAMLHDMEVDFAECARTNKSPCFFCAHDDTCDGRDCNFKWQSHN
jgi:hypothetical protein